MCFCGRRPANLSPIDDRDHVIHIVMTGGWGVFVLFSFVL